MAAGAVAGLISLIWELTKIGIKKKKTATGMQKNLPVIEWSAVQNLLDEA